MPKKPVLPIPNIQKGKSPRVIGKANLQSAIEVFRLLKTATIGDVARSLSLSVTATSKIFSKLEEKGYIYLSGKGKSSVEGGKRPDLYSLNEENHIIISINLSNKNLHCIAGDLSGAIRYSDSRQSLPLSYERTIELTAQMIQRAIDFFASGSAHLCGIVIGAAGIVDDLEGIIIYPVQNKEWGSHLNVLVDLRRHLSTTIPMYLENNGRLTVYSELSDPDSASNDLLAVISQSGKGSRNYEGAAGAVIRHKKLLRGANGFVGEFGHICVDPNSTQQCICGRNGCFQVLASYSSLTALTIEQSARYPQSILQPAIQENCLTMEQVFEAANAHDPLACFVVDTAAKYYAQLFESILVISDPNAIIINGLFTKAGDYFIQSLNRQINASALFGIPPHTQIRYTHLSFGENESFERGATLYGFDHFFAREDTYFNQEEGD